jgi:glycosyltransferase involved in cell wall biosynthesis
MAHSYPPLPPVQSDYSKPDNFGESTTIDIVVLTRNEEKNISDCLQSCQGLGRVIVIDDNSQDETVSLAEAAGAVVYTRTLDNFAAQRNFSLTKVTADWVFFLDADERLTTELAESIKQFVKEGAKIGAVRRRNHAFGHKFRFGPFGLLWHNRLFPNGRVQWEGLVHETPVTDLPVYPLDGLLEHYTYRNWSQYFTKFILYTKLDAEDMYEKGHRTSTFKACEFAVKGFIYSFINQLGILEGPMGWTICFYHGAYVLTKHMFLLDKYRGELSGSDKSDNILDDH